MTNDLTRRTFSSAVAGGAAGAFLGLGTARAAPSLPDAVDLAAQQRAGARSPSEDLAKALSAQAKLAPQLGFVAAATAEAAVERSKTVAPGRPLIPTLVKDLADQEGAPTRFGSAAFNDTLPAARSAAYVAALARTNAVSIGKSRTSEFGLSPVIEPIDDAPCRSPWSLEMSAGGSSGGAAAAVASGIVPFAHASDGGGSIRIPAALCGVFGFKPSRGHFPIETTGSGVTDIVCTHVVTRSVRDSALILAALQQDTGGLPRVPLITSAQPIEPLRIGVITGSLTGERPDAAVTAALEEASKLLRAAGHTVTSMAWGLKGTTFADEFQNLWAYGAASSVARTRAAYGDAGVAKLQPLTRTLAVQGQGLSSFDLVKLAARLQNAKTSYDSMFKDVDVLMTPVLTRASIPIGSVPVDGTAALEALRSLVGYTPIQNVAGAPAMSVPLGWTDAGLPIGIHFAGRTGDDERLIRLAFDLEARAPWSGRRPATYAIA